MSATTFYATNYRRVQHKCVSVVCLLWYILTQSVHSRIECMCVYQSEGKRAVNHILSSMATIATRLTELLVSAVECAE